MDNQSSIRKYNFSDGTLIQIANSKLQSANNDLVQFSDYGYTPAKIAEIEDAKTDFSSFPADAILDGDKQESTRVKKELRKQLETATRRIQSAAERAFKDSPERLAFGNTSLTRLSDGELELNASVVVEAAREKLSDLLTEGMTSAKLDDYETLTANFRLAMVAQNQAFAKRESSTDVRIAKGNLLYDLIVELCEVGKDIWVDKSPAQYNHYVIYNEAPKKKRPSKNKNRSDNKPADMPDPKSPSTDTPPPTTDGNNDTDSGN